MTWEDVEGRRMAAHWARQGRLLAEREAELDRGEKVVRPADVEPVDLDALELRPLVPAECPARTLGDRSVPRPPLRELVSVVIEN